MALATFAAGCFWGVEEAFRRIEGVRSTQVGYTGGHTDNPTYKRVCEGDTGHAEAVRIEYAPEQLSYDQLLDVFFDVHDPTQWHRQGPDVGSQYRSAIFYHDAEQQAIAQDKLEALAASGRYRHPIVTELEPAGTFYPAEAYHQQYLAKRGQGVCASTIQSA